MSSYERVAYYNVYIFIFDVRNINEYLSLNISENIGQSRIKIMWLISELRHVINRLFSLKVDI